jgi:hypothetical protein
MSWLSFPGATLLPPAVEVLYLAVFAEASLGKFADRTTPGWFAEKFAGTLLGRLPAPLMWWGIAVAEFAVLVLMAAALVAHLGGNPLAGALLRWGLLGATLVFAGLCFGLRISQDFAGAANAFFYGALTLLIWIGLDLVERGASP